MIDIVGHVHQYVPMKDGVFFGGDQLTVERCRSAQNAKIQSVNPKDRLQGLIPKAENWHARVRFLQVNISEFKSFCDKCTMHQIKILLNRSNAVLDPKSNFNTYTDFLDLITDVVSCRSNDFLWNGKFAITTINKRTKLGDFTRLIQ